MDEEQGALTQLQAYLAQRGEPREGRLPPERQLCDILGVSRGELRKALLILERNGELWRHVGKGTFLGAKPVEEYSSIAAIAGKSNPRQVMQARLAIEPCIAYEAAIAASAHNIVEMHHCMHASRLAGTWRQYENWDNRLHRTIAEATQNTILLALFDTLNAVRRAVVWGRLRANPARPPVDHHSFAEHQAVVRAIEERDASGGAEAMRRHLLSVEQHLSNLREAAE
ncbi:MAG: FadR/GntR family transcriptional regulator [Aestuariivirgaceae bacterium]